MMNEKSKRAHLSLPELNYLRGEGEEEEREEERRGNEEEPVGGARGRKLVWGGPFFW